MVKRSPASCPVCGNAQTVLFLQRPQHYLSVFLSSADAPEIDVEFYFCPSCGHVYLSSAFDNPAYQEATERLYKQYALLDNDVRPFPQRDKHYTSAVEFFRREYKNPPKNFSVLEVGSNRGDFLYLLKEQYEGASVLGVEPSKLPFYGVPTVTARFEECDFEERFDVIVIRHVLEHMEYPQEIVKKSKLLLRDGGTVFVEVPNLHYDLPRGIENFIPEHINHFSQNSLLTILAAAGLKATAMDDTRPEGLRLLASTSPEPYRCLDRYLIPPAWIDGYLHKIEYCMDVLRKAIEKGYAPCLYGYGNVFFCVLAELLKSYSFEVLCEKGFQILDDTPSKRGTVFKGVPIIGPEEGLARGNVIVVVCTMNPSHKQLMCKKVNNLAPSRSICLTAWEEKAHE